MAFSKSYPPRSRQTGNAPGPSPGARAPHCLSGQVSVEMVIVSAIMVSLLLAMLLINSNLRASWDEQKQSLEATAAASQVAMAANRAAAGGDGTRISFVNSVGADVTRIIVFDNRAVRAYYSRGGYASIPLVTNNTNITGNVSLNQQIAVYNIGGTVFIGLAAPQPTGGVGQACNPDGSCGSGYTCISNTCILTCTEGYVAGSACQCGSVSSCNVGQYCSLSSDACVDDCANGSISSQCKCGASLYSSGYCCGGSWQAGACPCAASGYQSTCQCATGGAGTYCSSGTWCYNNVYGCMSTCVIYNSTNPISAYASGSSTYVNCKCGSSGLVHVNYNSDPRFQCCDMYGTAAGCSGPDCPGNTCMTGVSYYCWCSSYGVMSPGQNGMCSSGSYAPCP